MSDRGKNISLLLITVVLTLAVSEIALRLWHGISPLALTNFRDPQPLARGKRRPVNVADLVGMVRYDATLGWAVREKLSDPGFHTLEQGIRRNNAGQAGLRPGNLLAVGPSLTLGLGVADEETWPAQLESLTGLATDNAGVPGFALDQLVLWAERLLPLARPKTLLLEFGSVGISMTGQSVSFGPKPFFTVENGVLRPQNIPVSEPAPRRDPLEPVKAALGYSHLIDRIMTRIDHDGWLSNRKDVMFRARNDPADVSCRLLERLKAETDKLNIDAVVVFTSIRAEIRVLDTLPEASRRVQECARTLRYRLVDVTAAFRAEYRANPKSLDAYYLPDAHFSALGNRRVAELVAAEFAGEPLHAGPP